MNKLQRFRFGSIPHREVARALAHKCALAGILFLEVDEAYTSKTSFPDAELPQYQSTYAGKRVKRGLFKTATGRLLNADVNAALQIGVRLLVGEGLLHLLTPQHRAEAVARSMNPVRTHVNLG
jgi:transposase